MLLWVLSSYLVLRRVDSELIASKVTTSGLVGWKPSIALTAVKLGTMNAKGRHQNRRKQCAENGDQLLAGFARRCQDGGCISRLICGRSGNRQSWQGSSWCRLWGSGRGVKPDGATGALVSMVVLKALAQQVPVSTQSVPADDAAGTGTDATGALSTDAPHAGQNRARPINSISAVAAVRHRVLLFLKSA